MTDYRSAKGKKVLQLLAVLWIILGGAIITFAFLKEEALYSLMSRQVTSTVQTSTSQTTVLPSESEVPSSSTPAASEPPAQEEENLVWEKQEAPVQLPILMYHAIHQMAPGEEANASLIVDPATFESHLKALQEAGYYALSPEEAYKVLTENVLPQGKKVVWLTFDDSLWDFYDIAYPLLKQYKMQATNNVITGTVGQEANLSLEEMKEMKENGMSFQGHTVNHPDLSSSAYESQQEELAQSKTFLDSELNQETIALAYPIGLYSEDTVALAEQNGYKLAVTTNNALATASEGLLTLSRIRILPTTTGESLLQEIAIP